MSASIVIRPAEEQNRIVSFAAGAIGNRREKDAHQVVPFHDGYITELYVVPKARNQGIGTTLVEACKVWFRESGCGAVHIEVFASNEGAIRFYKRLGYEARDIHQIKALDWPWTPRGRDDQRVDGFTCWRRRECVSAGSGAHPPSLNWPLRRASLRDRWSR